MPVASGKIVSDGNVVPAPDQMLSCDGADVPGTPGHQDSQHGSSIATGLFATRRSRNQKVLRYRPPTPSRSRLGRLSALPSRDHEGAVFERRAKVGLANKPPPRPVNIELNVGRQEYSARNDTNLAL